MNHTRAETDFEMRSPLSTFHSPFVSGLTPLEAHYHWHVLLVGHLCLFQHELPTSMETLSQSRRDLWRLQRVHPLFET